jgi:hypothetical protein
VALQYQQQQEVLRQLKDKIIAPLWRARPNLAPRARRQTISGQEKQLKL